MAIIEVSYVEIMQSRYLTLQSETIRNEQKIKPKVSKLRRVTYCFY